MKAICGPLELVGVSWLHLKIGWGEDAGEVREWSGSGHLPPSAMPRALYSSEGIPP